MKRPPKETISRLSLYLRILQDLAKSGSSSTISSYTLAKELGISSDQVRRDLWYFGQFGKRGIGYSLERLKNKISQILGLNKSWNAGICGVGNLGSALLAYNGFKEQNINIVAAFDIDPKKVGKKKNGVKIYHLREIEKVVSSLAIKIAIVATPSSASQYAVDKLVSSGIKAILNFAPTKITVPENVKLRSVDLSTELFNLTHFLSQSIFYGNRKV